MGFLCRHIKSNLISMPLAQPGWWDMFFHNHHQLRDEEIDVHSPQ